MSRFGSDINDVVCLGHQIHVMLDDNDRVTFIDEAMKNALEQFNIGGMEADGRLFQNVEGATPFRHPGTVGGATTGKLGDKLDALRLTATEGGARLAEAEITETCLHKELERAANFRMGRKKFNGLLDGHGEHITDGFPVVFDFQGLAVESGSAAILARHI